MARPLLDQEGFPIGALVLLRDMTAAVRIQQVIVGPSAWVAAGMAAGIAHTVNNVLQIISSNAEVLRRAFRRNGGSKWRTSARG